MISAQDKQAAIAFLRDLVRIPSPTTQEKAVAKRLAEEMWRVGFEQVFVDCIGNVVGRLGSGERPILLYNGHMDTVGIGDEAAWSRDPYGAEIEDGVLYGRGAADMKGALAAMVYGAKALVEAQEPLRGTLYVVGVVQEEDCEGYAMRVLVEEEGIRPDYVVLGECTDLHISRGQRGRMEMWVNVHGKACHASAPERGENAIYAAARVVSGLEQLAPRLAWEPFLGQGSLAVTLIDSTAGSHNVVPDLCSFCIDRRLTLGEDEQTALSQVEEVIAASGARAEVFVTEYRATSYRGYSCQAKQYYPPWVLPEAHFLVRACVRAIEQTLGFRPEIKGWRFSTDGVYTMGMAGIPTIGFGPGEERYTHTVEDQIRVEDVIKAARVYARLAMEVVQA